MAQNVNAIKIRRLLSDKGYAFIRQSGSHKIYKNPETGKEITIKEKLNKMVMKRLIKEIEVSDEKIQH